MMHGTTNIKKNVEWT